MRNSMHAEMIRENIKRGKENAVTASDLEQVTGLSRREISALVHELRQEGTLICAGICGYYIAESDEELISGYNLLWKRAVSILAVLKPMRREIKKRNLWNLTAEAKTREAKKRNGDAKETKNS